MPQYLTPQKLRSMALGTAFPGTDPELVELIRIASGLANRYCAAPAHHSFKGGSVLNEQHEWDLGNAHVQGSRRVFPNHRPIKDVSALRIRQIAGTSGYIGLGSDQMYVNNAAGYIEIVSFATSIATAHLAYLPNLGLEHPVAEVDYDYGWEIAVIDEELATASGETYLAESQFWTDDPVVVKVAGVAVASGYEIDRTEGSVTFDSPLAPGATPTVSYVHTLPPDIARATALIASDFQAQTRLNATGMQGLSGLRVLEVELRQSRTAGFANAPISLAVQSLLDPFRYRSFA